MKDLQTKIYHVEGDDSSSSSDEEPNNFQPEGADAQANKDALMFFEEGDSDEEEGEDESDQPEGNADEGWNVVAEQDDEGSDSEEFEEDDRPPPMPESIKALFPPGNALLVDYTKSDYERANSQFSLFTKVSKKVDTKTTSESLGNHMKEKAQKLFEEKSIFRPNGGILATAKSIKPLVSEKLDKKERQKLQAMTAGKNWGDMAKVELTEEVKADLRALRLRNQIFADRFYKLADSKKLPEYFQIGTVVDDSGVEGGKKDRLTKKERKGRIAEQLLEEDMNSGFSKRKYEALNDRKRRMGEKRRSIKISKKKRLHEPAAKSKGIKKK